MPATRAQPGGPGTRATPAIPAQPASKAKAAARDMDKVQDRAERDALRRADDQDNALLHGIKLTKSERQQVRAIEKRYDAQYRDLRKEAKNNGSLVSQINSVRDQERAEIRAALNASQQATFDRNASRYDTRR
ncbi:MAG: hypothetical protein ABR585_03960 [Gemmatimonadaceae bacterium]